MNNASTPSPQTDNAQRQAMRAAMERIDQITDRLYVGGSNPAG